MDMLHAVQGQIIDLGGAREGLEAYLVKCGYWGSEELRSRNAYVLSPSAYVLSGAQKSDLTRLAEKTYAAVVRLNETLCALAKRHVHWTHDQARLIEMAKVASRGLYRPEDLETRVPPVIKVDLVQDARGRFFIAEVDAYNPRGFGFAALLEESLPDTYRTSRYRFPGVGGLATLFKQSANGESVWQIVVSEYERYYKTAYSIFSRSLRDYGIESRLVYESDFSGAGALPLHSETPVVVIPDTLNKRPDMREALLAAYRSRAVSVFYPPVAYLGSKGFLPFLRACEGMQEFIPPTELVYRRHADPSALMVSTKPRVLKATVSSGMKKVLFSDLDPEAFARELETVSSSKKPSWILQQQVPQTSVSVTVFNDRGARMVQEYYLRVTAYIAASGVIDVEVTGRPDRKVHGAPDCIMIPVIFD